jgi:hypothetical protein
MKESSSDVGEHHFKHPLTETRTVILILSAMVVMALLALVMASDEADAWLTYDERVRYSTDGTTGYSRYNSPTYYKFTSTTQYTRTESGNTYYAFQYIPLDSTNPAMYVNKLTLRIRPNTYYNSPQVQFFYIPDVHPEKMDAQSLYNYLARGGNNEGVYLGTLTFTSTAYQTLSTTDSRIRNWVKEGTTDFWLCMRGIVPSSGYNWASYHYSYTYMTVEYDSHPPPAPAFTVDSDVWMRPLSMYLRWGAVNDNPSGGSVGNIQYQVMVRKGVWTGDPWYETSWTSNTWTRIYGLYEDATYYLWVRAKDGWDHVSGWSSAIIRRVDATPPSIPHPSPLPAFMKGTTLRIEWTTSVDIGSGIENYALQYSTDPLFKYSGTYTTIYNIVNTYYDLTVQNDTLYYYRVLGRDKVGHWSDPSESVFTIMDDTPPTVPGLEEFPEWSGGTSLTATWSRSEDNTSGVDHYLVQVFLTAAPVDVVDQAEVMWTAHTFSNLTHGEEYSVMVTAYDVVGNINATERMNTTMDAAPPTVPVVDAEPLFSAGSTNTLTWAASVDPESGVDHYIVNAYAAADKSTLALSVVTDQITFTFSGLADGATYWYEVVAVDVVGNTNTSALVSSTQDASPPTIPALLALVPFSKGDSVDLEWGPSFDAGIGGMEYELQWSSDKYFATVDSSGWLTQENTTATGLSDATRYYFRLRARDGFGQESAFGMVTYTTMDASPPPVPTMDALDPFVAGPVVSVSWRWVTDGSGQPVEYKVHAYDNPLGSPLVSSPWMRGNSFDFVGLDTDFTYYFRVVARDHMGWTSEPSSAEVTNIDRTPPSIAVIDEPEGWLKGPSFTVSWQTSIDDGIGGVMYMVLLYSDIHKSQLVASSDWITETSHTFLADGTGNYGVVVIASDANQATSEQESPAEYPVDMSEPTVDPDKGGLAFGPTDGAVSGTSTDMGSGVASVEYSVDGGTTWVNADLDGSKWSIDFGDLAAGTTEVLVRATDEVGLTSDHARCGVDTVVPEVAITTPAEGDSVSGAIIIFGSVMDAHLASYALEYSDDGGTTWADVQPEQATTGIAGILGTWSTAGLSSGNYIIRATGTDLFGQSANAVVSVTLKGAILSIGASDITFSNPHPLPGDKVTVLVTVRNDGDSPAEGITVKVFTDGKQAGQRVDVTVPARGTAVVPVEIEAEGEQEITAQATSPIYDTGEMASPSSPC